jgi:DNA adenine methylase
MYSNKLYTPLRYPGGKAVFAPFVAEVMQANGLAGGHYMEPYAGGAAVALELLFHGVAARVHINDLDPAVFSFWKAATMQPDRLLRLLHDTPINMEQWFYWRSVLRGEIAVDYVEQGFATLFLNRTNRSGILKAGVIGGLAQEGEYKIDARFKKEVIAARLHKIAVNAKSISVYCMDALEFVGLAATLMPEKSLIYLDPPYYVKGQGLYRNFYRHADHLAISEKIQSPDFGVPWVVSYDNAEQIHDMYSLSKSMTYGLNYTAQKRYVGNEVMFFAQGMNIPENAVPGVARAA